MNVSVFYRVSQRIHENYRRADISLQEVAEVVNLSPAHLSSQFKTAVGMSYVKYLTSVPLPTIAVPTAAAAPTPTAVVLPEPILLGDYPLLTPEEMRADLDELFHRLETAHPNSYAHRPKLGPDVYPGHDSARRVAAPGPVTFRLPATAVHSAAPPYPSAVHGYNNASPTRRN